MERLTENEQAALEILKEHGGSMLITHIPDRNKKGVLGELIPGMRVYQALDQRGLLVITEEEPDEDGFQWTPSVELTEKGRAALKGTAS